MKLLPPTEESFESVYVQKEPSNPSLIGYIVTLRPVFKRTQKKLKLIIMMIIFPRTVQGTMPRRWSLCGLAPLRSITGCPWVAIDSADGTRLPGSVHVNETHIKARAGTPYDTSAWYSFDNPPPSDRGFDGITAQPRHIAGDFPYFDFITWYYCTT